jgi:putative glutamine amidotransferase
VTAPPVVGVLACRKTRANGTTYSRVNDGLTASLLDWAGVAAVLLHTERPEHAAALLPRLDGLVLPGSGSFVHPDVQGPRAQAPVPDREYDRERDATALALLRQADLDPGLPVLASCRGMQELAVHCGGLLATVPESEVAHRLSGVPDRWGPAHPVRARPGGLLAGLAEGPDPWVNSQHSEHVAKVPGSVAIEAVAPDGVVEAISVGAPERFVLGVQWHFEHGTERSALDRRILAAFGNRCRTRAERRRP